MQASRKSCKHWWPEHSGSDESLAFAAQNALAKIGGVLPPEMRRALDDDAFYVSRQKEDASGLDLARVRQAMREQRKMLISYKDQAEIASERTIWPIMLGFVEGRRFIAGWCELREGFRLFRADRIVRTTFLDDRYSGSRRQLVKEWRAQEERRRQQQDGS